MWNLLNVDDDLLKHMLWFVQITGLDLLKRMTLAMQPDPSTCRSDASSNGMKPRARAQVGSVMIRPPKFSIAPVKLGKACLPTTIFQGKLLNLGGGVRELGSELIVHWLVLILHKCFQWKTAAGHSCIMFCSLQLWEDLYVFVFFVIDTPIPCMSGIFTHSWLICMVNLGKYTIHWLFVAVSNAFVRKCFRQPLWCGLLCSWHWNFMAEQVTKLWYIIPITKI